MFKTKECVIYFFSFLSLNVFSLSLYAEKSLIHRFDHFKQCQDVTVCYDPLLKSVQVCTLDYPSSSQFLYKHRLELFLSLSMLGYGLFDYFFKDDVRSALLRIPIIATSAGIMLVYYVNQEEEPIPVVTFFQHGLLCHEPEPFFLFKKEIKNIEVQEKKIIIETKEQGFKEIVCKNKLSQESIEALAAYAQALLLEQ